MKENGFVSVFGTQDIDDLIFEGEPSWISDR